MARPEVWPFDRLRTADLDRAEVWATPSVADRARAELHWPQTASLEALPDAARTLVAVGGGDRLDRAKAWRRRVRPELRLICVPSIWGSGAEASPICVLSGERGREILIGPEYLPDVRAVWPELASTVPADAARWACGDAWAHALEGFLSPLAGEGLRAELAALIREMLELPLAADPRWYEKSAQACAGQARSSVGLVHGFAHALEGPLRRAQPEARWGHARLCSTFLWPVLRFNAAASDKWLTLTAAWGIDGERVMAVARALHEPEAYDAALPFVASEWKAVLRDPCSRTNSALVRGSSAEFFAARAFH